MTKVERIATTILALSIALTMAACGGNGNISAVSQTAENDDADNKEIPSTSGWGIESIPAFDGGTNSRTVYSAGQGLVDATFPEALNSDMMVISETDTEMFYRYCGKLEENGYCEVFSNECDGNLFREFYGEAGYVYVYYVSAKKVTNVILDKNSTVSPEQFGYSYDKMPGDTTVLYQYGLPQIQEIVPYNDEIGFFVATDGTQWIDCGMCYIIRLADGAIVIIDGGSYHQFDEAQIDGMMRFMREITGTGENEKIRIAGWFITHIHSDHMSGMALFFKKYGSNFTLERIFCNFPTVGNKFGGYKTVGKFIEYLHQYLGTEFEFLKVHTGQVFSLADVSFDIIYTHEDCVWPLTGASVFGYDTNNTCTVVKVTFDDCSFMVLGDINDVASAIILRNNSDETLKADIVQVAHHTINNLSVLYSHIQPNVAFVPASRATASYGDRKQMMEELQKMIDEGMIFYSGDGTFGISVIDGKIGKVYEHPVDGGPYEGWDW